MDGIKKTTRTTGVYPATSKRSETSAPDLLNSVKSTLNNMEQRDELFDIRQLWPKDPEGARRKLVTHILDENLGTLMLNDSQKEKITTKILFAIETNKDLNDLFISVLKS